MNPDEFLTTEQLATLYPIDGRVVLTQWYRAVERWRDQGLLRLPEHIQPVGARRTYHHGRIVDIVWNERRLFSERVRFCHHAALVRILRNAPQCARGAERAESGTNSPSVPLHDPHHERRQERGTLAPDGCLPRGAADSQQDAHGPSAAVARN